MDVDSIRNAFIAEEEEIKKINLIRLLSSEQSTSRADIKLLIEKFRTECTGSVRVLILKVLATLINGLDVDSFDPLEMTRSSELEEGEEVKSVHEEVMDILRIELSVDKGTPIPVYCEMIRLLLVLVKPRANPGSRSGSRSKMTFHALLLLEDLIEAGRGKEKMKFLSNDRFLRELSILSIIYSLFTNFIVLLAVTSYAALLACEPIDNLIVGPTEEEINSSFSAARFFSNISRFFDFQSPIVRDSLLSSILNVSKRRGFNLPPGLFPLARASIQSDSESVRLLALKVVLRISQDNPLMTDEALVAIAGACSDTLMVIRATAGRLIGCLTGASEELLLRLVRPTKDEVLSTHSLGDISLVRVEMEEKIAARVSKRSDHNESMKNVSTVSKAPDRISNEVVSFYSAQIDATGALIVCLEDEYKDVRLAGLESIVNLSKESSKFRYEAIGLIIHLFKDEVELVREAAFRAISDISEADSSNETRKFGSKLQMEADGFATCLSALEEVSLAVRKAAISCISSVYLSEDEVYKAVMSLALKMPPNLKVRSVNAQLHFGNDDEGLALLILDAMRRMGEKYPREIGIHLRQLLSLDDAFLTPEPRPDNPSHIAILTILANALAKDPRAKVDMPEYAAFHISLYEELLRDFFPVALSMEADEVVKEGNTSLVVRYLNLVNTAAEKSKLLDEVATKARKIEKSAYNESTETKNALTFLKHVLSIMDVAFKADSEAENAEKMMEHLAQKILFLEGSFHFVKFEGYNDLYLFILEIGCRIAYSQWPHLIDSSIDEVESMLAKIHKRMHKDEHKRSFGLKSSQGLTGFHNTSETLFGRIVKLNVDITSPHSNENMDKPIMIPAAALSKKIRVRASVNAVVGREKCFCVCLSFSEEEKTFFPINDGDITADEMEGKMNIDTEISIALRHRQKRITSLVAELSICTFFKSMLVGKRTPAKATVVGVSNRVRLHVIAL